MSYLPGGTYAAEFTTSQFSTGAAMNASVLPVATATRNGTDDLGFVLTVTNLATGRYKITGMIPAYAIGDAVQVSIVATVDSVAGCGVVDSFVVGEAMRGTDSAALASVATELRLAELDAANLPADVANVQTAITNILADIQGVGWTNETLKALYDLVALIPHPIGSYTITLTLCETDETTPIPDQVVTLQTSDGTFLYSAVSDAAGQVVFQRSPGIYKLLPRTVPQFDWQSLTGGAWTVTVVDANMATTQYGTPLSYPAAVLPGQCAIWDYVFDDNGLLETTAGKLTVTVEAIYNPELKTAGIQDWIGSSTANDASGQWTLTLGRALDVLLRLDGQHYHKRWRFTVPAVASKRLMDPTLTKTSVDYPEYD